MMTSLALCACALMLLTVPVTSGASLEELTAIVKTLSRQLMMSQLFVEERIRSDGASGIKQIRIQQVGTQSYYADGFTGYSVASIHDHANNVRTVGMGEVIAVLNGVEFRTRHNDFRLMMPSVDHTTYGLTQDIPFPAVPQAVLDKENFDDAVAEMREWFKAWQAQDDSQRQYHDYFKPVLCYLEGAWTNAGQQTMEEPYYSDRHHVEADSFEDLHDKIHYSSYTGTKNDHENFAFLPTSVVGADEDGTPIMWQWNYRIMCHPIRQRLPLNRFRLIDDVAVRMARGDTLSTLAQSRAARFQLNPLDSDSWTDGVVDYGLLDKLMAEVPGRDNYPADLRETSFGVKAFESVLADDGTLVELNAGYYHRQFRTREHDAMGVQARYRGYADEMLFTAMNTRDEVANKSIEVCEYKGPLGGVLKCKTYDQKMSYAIPLEIIYTTPLSNWNPRNLQFMGDEEARAGGRDGGLTTDTAYLGTSAKQYFQTPEEFWDGGEVGSNAADTSRGVVGVLDGDGTVQRMSASGVRIILPDIGELKAVRQRYPIAPIHGEGNAVWKAMDAIKDVLLDPYRYTHMYRYASLRTDLSTDKNVTPHYHRIILTAGEKTRLDDGEDVLVTTREADGHTHSIILKFVRPLQVYRMVSCDGQAKRCSDGHRHISFDY